MEEGGEGDSVRATASGGHKAVETPALIGQKRAVRGRNDGYLRHMDSEEAAHWIAECEQSLLPGPDVQNQTTSIG
jgi:uncharacterized membrane protein